MSPIIAFFLGIISTITVGVLMWFFSKSNPQLGEAVYSMFCKNVERSTTGNSDDDDD